jgi:elongator complex protein 1
MLCCRRSSRAKRKADRNTGKKGTAEEEEYLLRSVTKLLARFAASSGNVESSAF